MIGFESIKSKLFDAYQSQKLHHAILLLGKKGVGKASFALEFAQEILGTKIQANPDLLVVEKEPEKREIGVEKIRKISEFFNKTSAISLNKFIIIDSACELNKSCSNALLKTLEEPRPNNFLILVAHNLNRVLPTIRSRCQIIRVDDLSLASFSQVLRQKNLQFSPTDFQFLCEICDNSPAQAIIFGNDLVRIYAFFLRSILNKKISDDLFKTIAEKNFPFAVFEKIYEFFINRVLAYFSDFSPNFYFDEELVFINLYQKFSIEKLFIIADQTLELLHKTTPFSLDKKLSLITIFNKIVYE